MFKHLTFNRQNEQANRLFQRLTELKYGNDAHDPNNLIQVIKFYNTLVEVGEYENSTSGFLQYLRNEIDLYEMDEFSNSIDNDNMNDFEEEYDLYQQLVNH